MSMRDVLLKYFCFLFSAAEKAENYNLQKVFFEAVTNSDLDTINKLVSAAEAPFVAFMRFLGF